MEFPSFRKGNSLADEQSKGIFLGNLGKMRSKTWKQMEKIR
jgi:hypothetical protein